MKRVAVLIIILAIFAASCNIPCIAPGNKTPHCAIQAIVNDVRPVFENEHLIACVFTARFGSEEVTFRMTGNEGSFAHDNVHICATLREGDTVKIGDNGSYYTWNKYSTSKK